MVGAVGAGGGGGGPVGLGGGVLMGILDVFFGKSTGFTAGAGGGGAVLYWKIFRIEAGGSTCCTLARRSRRRVGSIDAGSGLSSPGGVPWRNLNSLTTMPPEVRRRSARPAAGGVTSGAEATGATRTGAGFESESPANTLR